MNNRRKLVIEFGIATLPLQMAFAQAPITPAGRVWRVGILPGGPLAPRKFRGMRSVSTCTSCIMSKAGMFSTHFARRTGRRTL